MKSSDESQVKLNLEHLTEKLIHTNIQYDNHDIQVIDVVIGYVIRVDLKSIRLLYLGIS
jgi:hypothetical protein